MDPNADKTECGTSLELTKGKLFIEANKKVQTKGQAKLMQN